MSDDKGVRRTMSGASIIDRTAESRNKSVGNYNRFLKRNTDEIQRQVDAIIRGRKIADVDKGADIKIRNTRQPEFRIDPRSGERDIVLTGNDKFQRKDAVSRPRGGGRGGKASNDGEGEDDFVFHLDRDRFLEIYFEKLGLPNLVRKQLADLTEVEYRRGGVTLTGNPASISIFNTKKQNIMRRVARSGKSKGELTEAEEELERLLKEFSEGHPCVRAAKKRVEELRGRRPLKLDDHDVRYRNRVAVARPNTKAVMFCIMDVSGSMDEEKKDMAKHFFVLLSMLLKRNYEHIDVVFIRHHNVASRCSEEEFFNLKESGGTIVSSALTLTAEIIEEEYPPDAWNIYVAQASDGDNFDGDSKECVAILHSRILPKSAYFAYLEIAEKPQELWEAYGGSTARARKQGTFAMKRVRGPKDIYPVFHELFKKKGVGA